MKEEHTLYRLTSAQMLLYYNLKFSLKASVINICTTIHFENEINPELMLEATKLALRRNKTSATRIVKVKGEGLRQYFSDEEFTNIETVDFSKKSQKQYDAYIKKLSESKFPNHSMETQLFKVRLIKKPDGFYGLYFCVSHLAFDSYALIEIASDLLRLYVALRDNKPIPENHNDPFPAFKRDRDYLESERHQQDIEFWSKEVFGTEPQFTSINGMDAKEWKKSKGKRYGITTRILNPKAKHINYTVSKNLVSKVNEFAKTLGVPEQCVYLVALRNYLSKQSGRPEDVSILSLLANRSGKVMKNAGGTFAQAIPMRMDIPNTLSFADACVEVKKIQYRLFKHSRLPAPEILKTCYTNYKKPLDCGYMYLNLTYQPFFVPPEESVPAHFTMHSNGANAVPLYLMIISLDTSGDLTFNYNYNTWFATPKSIDRCHNYVLKFLETAIAQPETTLEKLMDL